MSKELKRMWINQPSTMQPFHAKHGTNVLAEQESDNVMRIYPLSGDIISQQMPKNVLSEGWRPTSVAEQHQKKIVVDVVTGLHNTLSRMIETYAPDNIDAEWLGDSNELIRNLTGHNVRIDGSRFNRDDNDSESLTPPAM